MPNRASFRLRSLAFSLRGGFLVRPLAIALLPGSPAHRFRNSKKTFPLCAPWSHRRCFHRSGSASRAVDPGDDCDFDDDGCFDRVRDPADDAALASTEFSPRILTNFVRDHVTQWTLGMFLGAFCYCIAALPAARSLPQPFAPVLATAVAMALAPLCVALLIFFIYHISRAISVNHIVDRIARETEFVIDELMPETRRPLQRPERPGEFSGPLEGAYAAGNPAISVSSISTICALWPNSLESPFVWSAARVTSSPKACRS